MSNFITQKATSVIMEGYEPTIAPSAVEMLSELQRGSTHVMEINVLMVEDDEFQRTVLTQLFERANADNAGQVKFQVMLMESAAAALEHLKIVASPRKCDLLLLDVYFPGQQSGEALLPEFRKALGERTAIVMLSAHQENNLVKSCLTSGADAFLVKPVQAEQVRVLWQYCLKRGIRSAAPAPPRSNIDPGPRSPGCCNLVSGPRPGPIASLGGSSSASSRSPRASVASPAGAAMPGAAGGGGGAISSRSARLGAPSPAGTPRGEAAASSVYSRCRQSGNAVGRLRAIGRPVEAGAGEEPLEGCKQQ